MIFDKQNMFCDQQAITADVDSENVIDLGNKEDVVPGSMGEGSRLHIQVTEGFNNLTDLTINLDTSDDLSDEALDSPTTLQSTNIALADLVAGKRAAIVEIPEGASRYLGLSFAINGAAPTTGKITAGIVLNSQTR